MSEEKYLEIFMFRQQVPAPICRKFWLIPVANLANSFLGCLAVWLHQKIEGKNSLWS